MIKSLTVNKNLDLVEVQGSRLYCDMSLEPNDPCIKILTLPCVGQEEFENIQLRPSPGKKYLTYKTDTGDHLEANITGAKKGTCAQYVAFFEHRLDLLIPNLDNLVLAILGKSSCDLSPLIGHNFIVSEIYQKTGLAPLELVVPNISCWELRTLRVVLWHKDT